MSTIALNILTSKHRSDQIHQIWSTVLKATACQNKMLGKLRRKSKDIVLSFATKRHQEIEPPFDSTQSSAPPNKRCNFLDLPAELRIHIYELVAKETKLSLLGTSSKPKPPPLLFVTRQIREEFRPILLSISPVRVHITDYHFRPLIRLVGSLYSSELKALRSNTKLEIELHVKHPKGIDKDSIASLRQWAVKRAEHLDRLPWTYELAKPEPACIRLDAATDIIGRYTSSLEAIICLERSLHESLAAEIQPVIDLLKAHCVWWRSELTDAYMAGSAEGLSRPQIWAKTISLISISGVECQHFALLHRQRFTQAGNSAPTPS